jgi:hypothetical protein
MTAIRKPTRRAIRRAARRMDRLDSFLSAFRLKIGEPMSGLETAFYTLALGALLAALTVAALTM